MKRLLLVMMCFISAVYAEDKLVEIPYGATHVDVNGDGVDDVITRFHWDNMNAHSYDEYTVAVMADGKPLLVPFGMDVSKKKRYHFQTFQGAECVLKGYKFELKQDVLHVIQYERRLGESFADAQPVTVTEYVLQHIADENLYAGEMENGSVIKRLSGDPIFFFKEVNQYVTDKKYCDARKVM